MRKYKVGTKLRALKSHISWNTGDIIEIIKPTLWFSSYALKGGTISVENPNGWDPNFVDDEINFEPAKITNWRQRIK